MAFSKSRHRSKIKLSSQEMFAISQEINSEFSPSFSSNMPGPVQQMKLAPKELFAISQEISREFSPAFSNPSLAFDVPLGPVQEPLLASLQSNNRQLTAGSDSPAPEVVSQITLEPNELAAISQDISRAFTPHFSSKLSETATPVRLAANELLEISQEISREFAVGAAMASPELIILPVDPCHLHAYWHVDEHKAGTEAKSDFEEPLTLRIYAQASTSPDRVEPESWFDLPIEGFQSQQKVSLPTTMAETVYSAAIGKCQADNSFAVLAYSNITPPARGGAESYGYRENRTVSRAQALSVRKNASGLGK